jgi:hypothetical protein
MEIAPPPGPGSRIQELGDSLVVRFRPRRSWGQIAFLTFWLALWTFFGIAALVALGRSDWGERAFLLVWLCGWSLGECAATVEIAWQLCGRELLTVTPHQLEVRREIGRLARTKRYEVGLVEDVSAARVPTDEDEDERKDFCLQVSYGGKKIRVGEEMGEREAEHIAATLLSKIRPRTWWGDGEQLDPYAASSL